MLGKLWRNAAAAVVAALLALAPADEASAQAIGGNTSISATVTSANAVLTANTQNYPSMMIVPAPGTTVEVFYALGDSTVAATTSSPSLPSGGVCVNVGPSTYVAAITGTGSATVRITQLTTCALFSSNGGGGGGGSGTVTSVGLALDSSVFSVSGSPVTASGTLTGSLVTQMANYVWAGPATGAAANPTFRALVAADLPVTFSGTAGQVAVYSGATALSGYAGLTYTIGTGQLVLDAGVALGATTALLVNPATATGLLADFQVGGVSQWSASAGGATVQLGSLTVNTGGASILTSPGAANWQLGAANVNGAPVAQTLSFQGALAGSATNQAGASSTIKCGGAGTGTGTNGDCILQTWVKTTTGTAQATATTALTIKGETQQVVLTAGSSTVPAISWGTSNTGVYGTSTSTLFTSSGVLQAYITAGQTVLLTGIVSLVTAANIFWNADTYLSRNAAGVLQIGATSGTASGSLVLSNITATGLANVATTSAVCYNTGTGVLTYDGTIGTCTISDETLKIFDAPIPGSLGRLVALAQSEHFGYFHWIDGDGSREIGIGAQTVGRYFPEFVERGSNGLYSLAYHKLTVPIISALAELNDRLTAIENRR